MCKKIVWIFIFVALSGCTAGKYVANPDKPSVKVTFTSLRDIKIGLFTHGSSIFISDEDCKNTRVLGTIKASNSKKKTVTFDIEADKAHIITFRSVQHGGTAILATKLSPVLGTSYEVNFFPPSSSVWYERVNGGERSITKSISKPKKRCKIY